ncbi:MAG: branched-chain amino acid ABC transporter permease [Planctomycetes bacterium]|nr:branched-chain amino acid ABC transporter permease [Planctomycetota bacterium]
MDVFRKALKRVGLVNVSIIAILLLIAALPLFTTYSLGMDVLIFGLFAMSYNIIHGHMGQVSFGHCMFFGLGAYFTALLLYWLRLPSQISWIYLPLGVTGATLVAILVGTVVLQRRGIYFTLTNVAFQQLFYFLVLQLKGITKGDEGISNIPVPFDLMRLPLFYVSLGIVVGAVFLMKRIFIDSSFGLVLHAVRDSEERTQFVGYNTFRHMLKAYVMSAMFAALAGGLYVMHLHYVGLTMMRFELNAEVVIMTVLGGARSFIGPLIGAAVFYVMKDFITSNVGHWQLILGILVMAIIMFLRDGLVGRIKALKF